MHRPVSRRDFIHGAGLLTLGAGLPFGAAAQTTPKSPAYYPPTLTGLRGSHPGSFEIAHALAREGRQFTAPTDLDEEYDLVVVGAGISGLAAAWFYRERYGSDARILLLDNHDDFGGHAKRNEFHQGGTMRLAMGGSQNLEHWDFNDVVRSLLDEFGVDIAALRENMTFDYGRTGRNGTATWFDADTYGEDRLITGFDAFANPDEALAVIDDIPVSESARIELKQFYSVRRDILKDKSGAERRTYLKTTPYTEFLRRHGGLGEEARQLFETATHSNWAFDLRNLSIAEAFYEGLPGRWLLGEKPPTEKWDYPVGMFPDGNASMARLLAQSLIPGLAPGTTADNVALARFDYEQIDRPDSPVRIRLNATVTHAGNTGAGVAITYHEDGRMLRVKGRHCVLACYHAIIPHLCPELPEAQKAAQRFQVKSPLVQTNVLLRSAKPMDKLGITGAHCPGRMHEQIFMAKGIDTGGYDSSLADSEAVPVYFGGTLSPPADIADLRDQLRASRAMMLALRFEDYEREVRTVLDGMLSPAGFDVQQDILAITVNRWPHGYAYEYLDLWDPEWAKGEAPHEVARQAFGNISIANSDAGASAYIQAAINEAHRAVTEMAG